MQLPSIVRSGHVDDPEPIFERFLDERRSAPDRPEVAPQEKSRKGVARRSWRRLSSSDQILAGIITTIGALIGVVVTAMLAPSKVPLSDAASRQPSVGVSATEQMLMRCSLAERYLAEVATKEPQPSTAFNRQLEQRSKLLLAQCLRGSVQ